MIESLLIQMLLALPLILGAYLSLSLMKLPDLSIESAYLFGAVLAAACQETDVSPFLLFATALAGGALVGLTTGVLNQCLHIPLLLAAIAVNGLFHGVSQLVLGHSMVSLKNSPFEAELGLLAGIGIISSGAFALKRFSQLGRCYAIYGNNPQFLKHHGISTPYVVITGLMLADAAAGLAGYLFAQSNGFVDLSLSNGTILLAITALVLGKMAVGRPSLLIPMTGLVIFFFLQQLLLSIGLDLKYFNSFQSMLVIGALCILNKDKAIDHLGV